MHRLGISYLSGLVNLFFRTLVKYFHWGFIAFRKDKINEIYLNCAGIEFVSKMICKVSIYNLKVRFKYN